MPFPRSRFSTFGLTLILAFAGLPATGAARSGQAAPPLALGGEPLIDPADLAVTVFAAGLPFPYGMAELPDGSLLVATSVPTGGAFFASSGELVRLTDENGDGVADGPPQPLAIGLPGALTSIGLAGDLVFAVSSSYQTPMICVLRLGEGPADPLTWVGAIELLYPLPMDHGTYGLAVRPVPGEPEQHELFFNVGAIENFTAGGSVVLAGLVEATLADAAVYRLTVDDGGPAPVFDVPQLIASGLRNAAGLTFRPETGDLYIADNGIDTPADRIIALSTDEVNRIAAADIGGAIEDFGFPYDYVDYHTGERVGDGGIPPLAAFVPLNGSENEGTAELVIAPAVFPSGRESAAIVGFHGQWDDVGLANEENPLAYVDLASGEYVHLIGNEEPLVGHLDGLLATAGAVYVADLTGAGSLAAPDALGVIYRIAPTAR